MSATSAPAAPGRTIPPSVFLLVTASALLLLGRTSAGLLAAGIAVVGQQLAWLYPATARRAATAFEAGVKHLGHGLTEVLFAALHVVVILPGWLITGRSAVATPSAWVPVSHDVSARRMYSHDPANRPSRDRRTDALVGAAIVAAAIVVAALATPAEEAHRPLQDRATATAELPAALADQPDAAAVLAEQGQAFGQRVPDDRLSWVLGTSTGDLVNVRDGERVTPTPPGAGDDPLEVWFFGGSLTWGVGQSDARTIPARFAARATEAGIPVRARNFAVPAYMIEQSSILFERELARQPVKPDLVVFLDGYNEMYGAMGSTLAGVAPGTPFSAYTAKGAAGVGRGYHGPTATLEDRYEGVLAMHQRGRDRARRAAEAAGVDLAFAWQPNVYSRPAQPGERATLAELGWTDAEIGELRTADAEIRRRLPPGIVDLGGVFDTADEPIYLDTVHVNERGADLLAAALVDDLAPRLARLEEDQ